MPDFMEFSYHNPTEIHFGTSCIPLLARLIPPTARVLLLYGGGSIRRNGVYDTVTAALSAHCVQEFSGVEPNPSIETLQHAIEQVRREQLDFVLAVGGGSVCDAAKFVAAAACYDGDGWDLVSGKAPVLRALPVGVVLTLAATGSESNIGSVISRRATAEKRAFFARPMQPRFALLNPAVLGSLPDRQLANGLVDAFVHVCEQYLTFPVGALVQDGYAETLLRTLKTLADTFEQRRELAWQKNLMWAANQALCGIVGVGVPHDWATHRIGVELTALYGLDHGRTLSIIHPWLLRETVTDKAAKLCQMSERVFGHRQASAETAIQSIEALYRSLSMPVHLSDEGIKEADASHRIMSALRAHGNAALGGFTKLDETRTERIVCAACS